MRKYHFCGLCANICPLKIKNYNSKVHVLPFEQRLMDAGNPFQMQLKSLFVKKSATLMLSFTLVDLLYC